MQEKLKAEFKKIYSTEISSTKGLESLAIKIGVSKNTLRRFLGKIDSNHQLSISSLNLFAKFLGYKNFYEFSNEEVLGDKCLDFNVLKIFYDTVKGKGVILNEKRFQDANYEFAKKIILNQRNLQEFVKIFSKNLEALEYVLAWHPTYGRIAEPSYQNSMTTFANICDKSHIKVSVSSFILFGKFLSFQFESETEVENQLKYIGKITRRMRNEYHFYWDFPEVRYAIVTALFYYFYKFDVLLNIEIKSQLFDNKITNLNSKIIHHFYFADCLNLINKYEDANAFQSQFTSKNLNDFCKDNYHYKTQIPFFKVCRAITLCKIGSLEESKKIFFELAEINFSKLPFDIKDYVELQFFLLGTYLFPDFKIYREKLKEIINKTGFSYFRKFL